jgi:hypothetical protein
VAMRKTEKGAGRPARRAGERLSKNRTFRVRPQLDEQLADAAGSSGRSVSEEIELRLEQSFTKQQSMLEALDLIFGRENAALAMVIAEIGKNINWSAALLALARKNEPKQACWFNDLFLFNEFSSTVSLLLEAMRPPGDLIVPDMFPSEHGQRESQFQTTFERMLKNLGARTAGAIFALPAPPLKTTGWAALIRDRLSPEIKARLLNAARE